MQTWFVRAAWSFKMNTLLELLKGIRSIQSLSILLNTLYSASGKAFVYTEAQYCPIAIFDKPLNDHNRAMDLPTLINEHRNSILWFNTLSDEDQVTVFIGLLRLAGGFIIRKMYAQAVILYHQKLDQVSHVSDRDITGSWNQSKLLSNSQRSDMSSYTTDTQTTAFTVVDETLKIHYDPNNPYSKEVEKLRKLWDEKMKKYKAELEKKSPKKGSVLKNVGVEDLEVNENKTNKEGKIKKQKKKNQQTRKNNEQNKKKEESKNKASGQAPKNKMGKSDKSKSSKSIKKATRKKGKNETICQCGNLDQLQMLPIWIMKYILSMLDKKSLEQCWKVSPYWNSVINSLLEEKKARVKINKIIAEKEAELKDLKLKHDTLVPKQVLIKYCTITPLDRRLIKLFCRGAVRPKLRPIPKPPLYTKCIYEKLVSEAPHILSLPAQFVRVFPREPPKNSGKDMFYRKPECILHEYSYDSTEKPEDKLEQLNKFKTLIKKQDSICKTQE